MKYEVWLWVTAAPELDPGQIALKVAGPGLRKATTAQLRDMAAYIENVLNGYKPTTREGDQS